MWNVYGLTEATVVQTAVLLNNLAEELNYSRDGSSSSLCRCIGCPMIGCDVTLLPVVSLPKQMLDKTSHINTETDIEPNVDTINSSNVKIYGEICIRGKQLGLGYLNDEERTRHIFIHDSSLHAICQGDKGINGKSVIAGCTEIANGTQLKQIGVHGFNELGAVETSDIWMRTGDMGWWDGRYFHVKGRLDSQVKIRGRRVDLAEIDAAVMAGDATKVNV